MNDGVTFENAATKECRGCKKRKPIDEFYEHRQSGGRRSRCKACTRSQNADWQAKNPEHFKRLQLSATRRQRSRLRFELEPEDYEKLVELFGPVCGICGKPETRADRKRLSLDHDHSTDELRGALCSTCNFMIGLAKDDPALLEKAAAYLRDFRQRMPSGPEAERILARCRPRREVV
jgi:hypothetical protein